MQITEPPWKAWNEALRWLGYPAARLLFALNGVAWQSGWRLYGLPVIQKHRGSLMAFGAGLQLRSSLRANPLGANHAVILCTWQAGARLVVGADFGMTGGTLCVAQSIEIGNGVIVGANSTIVDTDFHPLEAEARRLDAAARCAPVVIEDEVFIGMNCLILKGARLGRGCVVGAGSVVTGEVAAGMIVAGSPAQTVGEVRQDRRSA